MPTLTGDEAEALRVEFVGLFSSMEAFNESWNRCWQVLRKPSLLQARKWLEEDLVLDRVRHRGVAEEVVVPNLGSSFELSDCPHCGGKRYVKTPIPDGLTRAEAVRYPGFGVANPCQFCDDSAHKTACDVCRKASETLAESAKNSGPKARRKRGKKSEEPAPARDYVGELARKLRMP